MELSEYKFFYENGEKIVAKDGKTAKERFIEFYSEKYRKKNEKQWDLEVEMEKFLDPDNGASWTTEDIAHILFWKAGTKQKPPQDGEYRINNCSRTIIIGDNQKEVSEMNRFNGSERKIDECSAKDFVSYFTRCGYAASHASKAGGEPITNHGIGFVYAVTLLFIATKGAYPIYDRYAHVGLKSACSGGNPTDGQSKITESYYCSKMFHLPCHHGGAPITGVEFDRAWKEYMGYKHLLMEKDEESEGIFWDVYDKYGFHYRDVDRALWKYGHLFYESNSKNNKIKK